MSSHSDHRVVRPLESQIKPGLFGLHCAKLAVIGSDDTIVLSSPTYHRFSSVGENIPGPDNYIIFAGVSLASYLVSHDFHG
ncbi:hypothetical protein RRG08_048637 [Elysia crispata]|uniref:Uncharacterized protein n=1 Tax=Elysia crispata TaxID=231223 RepID=A0AAE1DXT9_9GAST|nr:hypothetical protein RRG08_048637 [Elysia crispata]